MKENLILQTSQTVMAMRLNAEGVTGRSWERGGQLLRGSIDVEYGLILAEFVFYVLRLTVCCVSSLLCIYFHQVVFGFPLFTQTIEK